MSPLDFASKLYKIKSSDYKGLTAYLIPNLGPLYLVPLTSNSNTNVKEFFVWDFYELQAVNSEINQFKVMVFRQIWNKPNGWTKGAYLLASFKTTTALEEIPPANSRIFSTFLVVLLLYN